MRVYKLFAWLLWLLLLYLTILLLVGFFTI